MYAVNEPAMNWNEAVLNDLPGELYTIKADDNIHIIVNTTGINSGCSESKANKNWTFNKAA